MNHAEPISGNFRRLDMAHLTEWQLNGIIGASLMAGMIIGFVAASLFTSSDNDDDDNGGAANGA